MPGMVVQQQLRRRMAAKVARPSLLLVMMSWNISGSAVLDIVRSAAIMCVEYKCRYVRHRAAARFWNRVRYRQWRDYLAFVIMIANDTKKAW